MSVNHLSHANGSLYCHGSLWRSGDTHNNTAAITCADCAAQYHHQLHTDDCQQNQAADDYQRARFARAFGSTAF